MHCSILVFNAQKVHSKTVQCANLTRMYPKKNSLRISRLLYAEPERPHTVRPHSPPQGFLLFYRNGGMIDSDGCNRLGLQKTAAFSTGLVLVFDAELRSGWICTVRAE